MKYFRNSDIKFLIDILSYSSFVFLCTTGLLMSFILPPGSGNRYQVWGLDRHQWGDIHFWVSMFFLATIVLHLIMHWKWIWIMIRGKGNPGFSLRGKLGIAGTIVALILFASPLISPVQQNNESRGYGVLQNDPPRRNQNFQPGRNEFRGYGGLGNQPVRRNRAQSLNQNPAETKEDCQDHVDHDTQDYVIRGNMNLQEVSDNTGVPVDYLVKELNLPVNVSVSDHLGQLRRSYGFHLQDVRDAVTDYL